MPHPKFRSVYLHHPNSVPQCHRRQETDNMDLSDALGGGPWPGQNNQQAGGWPGQPNQPTWPSQPSNPTWPGQPNQPAWPGQQPGGQPAQPAWPGQPNQPAWPSQQPGGQPAQPAWPGQPNQPAWPSQQPGGQPAQPAWPGQPNQPAWPGQQPGGQPAQPAWPGQPNQPAWPGQQPSTPGWPGPNPATAPHVPIPQRALTVPYEQVLPSGVYDKLLITINGQVKPNAKTFTINLSKGKDVAFHFNPRFNEGGRQVIVRNSMIGATWGKEERDGSFPFAQGMPFELKILCTRSGFKVAVNKAHLLEFHHRVRELNMIRNLVIYNDVTLSSVNMETLP